MTALNPSWFPDENDPDGGAAWQERRRARLASYEERALKRICPAIGVRWQDLLRISQERGDDPPRLHFPLFNEEVDFPVQLGVGELIQLHRLEVGDLFRRFDQTALARHFVALAATFDPGQAAGMVFEWVHVSPFMVVHTFPAAPRAAEKVKGKPPPPDVRVVAKLRIARGDRRTVVMEPLDALLRCF